MIKDFLERIYSVEQRLHRQVLVGLLINGNKDNWLEEYERFVQYFVQSDSYEDVAELAEQVAAYAFDRAAQWALYMEKPFSGPIPDTPKEVLQPKGCLGLVLGLFRIANAVNSSRDLRASEAFNHVLPEVLTRIITSKGPVALLAAAGKNAAFEQALSKEVKKLAESEEGVRIAWLTLRKVRSYAEQREGIDDKPLTLSPLGDWILDELNYPVFRSWPALTKARAMLAYKEGIDRPGRRRSPEEEHVKIGVDDL
jgi:hypothetical protein